MPSVVQAAGTRPTIAFIAEQDPLQLRLTFITLSDIAVAPVDSVVVMHMWCRGGRLCDRCSTSSGKEGGISGGIGVRSRRRRWRFYIHNITQSVSRSSSNASRCVDNILLIPLWALARLPLGYTAVAEPTAAAATGQLFANPSCVT